MKRTAFTMIELVFVIVILGILAAVAIPRLAATRDDAVASGTAQNITSGASEIAAYATANGTVLGDLTQMSNGMKALVETASATNDSSLHKVTVPFGAISSCISIQIVTVGGTDTLTITQGSAGSDSECLKLQQLIDTSIYPMILRGTNVVL
ncbi:MAG: prepilin-type N-terminal cleavage/methylation domain-containing protein [Pseudomonadota bacterium]